MDNFIIFEIDEPDGGFYSTFFPGDLCRLW